jgi:biopolymer transport protein ExbD
MAMQGFDRDELQAPLAEINTTPLVDVMLVLLVIFLVTAPMLNNSIKLQLPNESASEITEQKAITISVDNTGKYFLDDKNISEAELDQHLAKIAENDAKQIIHIRADTNATYGKVAHVLSKAQQLGLNNVGFITEPK